MPPFVRDPAPAKLISEYVQIPDTQPPIPTFADGGYLKRGRSAAEVYSDWKSPDFHNVSKGRVDGVAKIPVQGGEEEEYRVIVDPVRMRAHKLTILDVGKALTASNVLTVVGRLEDHDKIFLVLSKSRYTSPDQIGHTILKSGNDGIVELEDVATVGVADKPLYTRATADGKAAVLMPVYQQPGANTVAIGTGLTAKLASLSGIIPKGVVFHTWYDQGALVSDSVGSVRDAIAIGIGLAAVVLFLFLRSWKITLIGVFVVPVVLAATGLFGKDCTPYTVHYAYDTTALTALPRPF